MEHYYERMAAISDFIVHTIPALNNAENYMSVEQLCELFYSELFCSEEIMSFAPEGESGAKYLYDLLSSYDMIPKMDGIVVRIVTGAPHEILTEDEKRLCNLLAEGRKYSNNRAIKTTRDGRERDLSQSKRLLSSMAHFVGSMYQYAFLAMLRKDFPDEYQPTKDR